MRISRLFFVYYVKVAKYELQRIESEGQWGKK